MNWAVTPDTAARDGRPPPGTGRPTPKDLDLVPIDVLVGGHGPGWCPRVRLRPSRRHGRDTACRSSTTVFLAESAGPGFAPIRTTGPRQTTFPGCAIPEPQDDIPAFWLMPPHFWCSDNKPSAAGERSSRMMKPGRRCPRDEDSRPRGEFQPRTQVVHEGENRDGGAHRRHERQIHSPDDLDVRMHEAVGTCSTDGSSGPPAASVAARRSRDVGPVPAGDPTRQVRANGSTVPPGSRTSPSNCAPRPSTRLLPVHDSATVSAFAHPVPVNGIGGTTS